MPALLENLFLNCSLVIEILPLTTTVISIDLKMSVFISKTGKFISRIDNIFLLRMPMLIELFG